MTPPPDGPASILIVDDHPLFATGFMAMTQALRPAWVLRTATTAAQAESQLHRALPHLVLVDVGLPGEDGFALLQRISRSWPGLPVVLISGRDDAAIRVRARASGAVGFIAKTAAPDAIAGALDAALAGRLAFDTAPDSLPDLTTRQAEILELLAAGCANKEIRHRLGIAERTVRAHLTELFLLLGVSSRMQAVIRARELGLVAG